MKTMQVLCILTIFLQLSNPVIADALLFHESFDSVEAIQNNGGTSAKNGWPVLIQGVVGNAADFSGSKAIAYPMSENLDISQGTLEFWVNTPNTNRLGFFDIGSLGLANSWGIFKNSNHIIMEVKNSSNRFDQAWSPAPIAYDGLWHMVTAVWELRDSTTYFKVCWDGTCKSKFDGITGNSFPNPDGNFWVGWTGWYGYSQSSLDELKIYDYVKTDQEILETFNRDSLLLDKIKPVIDLINVNTQTLNIGDTYVSQPFSATDNRDGDISHLVVQRGVVDTTKTGAYRLSYNVADEAGNNAIERVRTIHVLDLSVDNRTRAFNYLEEVMDQYHKSFDVYTDFLSGGNHATASGWMGQFDILEVDPKWQANCYNGHTCFKNIWETTEPNWVGIRWLQPDKNWAELANAGFDLSKAIKLTFYAIGEVGGESVEFVVGGVEGEYPDSLQPAASTGTLSLTTDWKKYEIPLSGQNLDLSHIISPFGWIVKNDTTFYIDDVKLDLQRTDTLRFLQSFTLLDINAEFALVNTAYVYDNTLALLAFLARGGDGDIQRARILADALVYAQENDRHYTDGRLRNAYMSGDLFDPSPSSAKLPGWWDVEDQEWYEDEFNASTNTGNIAWAMLALITFYEVSSDDKYLNAAIRMGDWVEKFTRDDRGFGGYTGGFQGWEQTQENPVPPTKLMYKATEHNIDLYPAFQRLYLLTQNEVWKERADHAKQFVDSMWDSNSGFFWTGTDDSGVTVNSDNIPVNVQAWAVMAMPSDLEYRRGLDWAVNNCALESDGFQGFDFNCNELDGIWFEGTSQMALAYKIDKRINQSQIYLKEIRKAQIQGTNNNGKGIIAASHDGVSTGFDWEYFSRLHVGTTAWYLFAEMGYNPYWHEMYELIANGDNYTTEEDTAFTTGNVLTNDISSSEGDILTIVSINTENTSGAVLNNNDGTFIYTPPDNFPEGHASETDSFFYVIEDGNGGSANGTVTITVNAVNDDPIAESDDFSATQNSVLVTPNVLANDQDVDGDELSVMKVDATSSQGGTVINNLDGTFKYEPSLDFVGKDGFSYTVQDNYGGISRGFVNITVSEPEPVDNPPPPPPNTEKNDSDDGWGAISPIEILLLFFIAAFIQRMKASRTVYIDRYRA